MDLESTNTQISQVDEKREFFRSAGYGNHYELLICWRAFKIDQVRALNFDQANFGSRLLHHCG